MATMTMPWVSGIKEPVCPCCSKTTSSNDLCTRCAAVFSDIERQAMEYARLRLDKLFVLQASMTPSQQRALHRQRVDNAIASDERVGGMMAAAGAIEDNPYLYATGAAIIAGAGRHETLRAAQRRTAHAMECNPAIIRACAEKLGVMQQQPVKCRALEKSYVLDVYNIQPGETVLGSVKMRRVFGSKMREFEFAVLLDDKHRCWNVVPF